ncbi:hypothetical protein AXG93_4776s1470 [Marchantia polymorpha subsp. ruderalis]|uniref:Uncharacterized protein n=1 Tax=Marchantia polymorpha subsp. ruderalis TaxID=1480154 RepID=A0A176VTX2_MARPO|nr:hypothetical protein AXG93_4776s1470 [Marchantia polymorpha subsp. ruderalis]
MREVRSYGRNQTVRYNHKLKRPKMLNHTGRIGREEDTIRDGPHTNNRNHPGRIKPVGWDVKPQKTNLSFSGSVAESFIPVLSSKASAGKEATPDVDIKPRQGKKLGNSPAQLLTEPYMHSLHKAWTDNLLGRNEQRVRKKLFQAIKHQRKVNCVPSGTQFKETQRIMDSNQLTINYSAVQDSLCNDKYLPTNVPCSNDAQHVVNSKRKRARQSFPWAYTRDWKAGDLILQRQQRQYPVCCKWFCHKTNVSGWKAHLRLHGITDNDNDSFTSSGKLSVQATLSCVCKPRFSTLVLEGFENAVVDYVVQGGVTLRAAGSERFKQFVVALTHGYEPPSTRIILRRIVELHRVLEPALAAFLCNVTVAISLTLDGQQV